ncbi:MAG: hypothetical protein HC877_18980 [Thioploca sp.]|nr:hypothetical protein [Thioploca sp.]
MTVSQITNILCATRNTLTDTSYDCTSATTDISYICGLASNTSWIGFEQNGVDRCSTINALPVGSPTYAQYAPDSGWLADAVTPDIGWVDGGVLPLVILTSPSYTHWNGGTPQLPIFISPLACEGDASTCAYMTMDGSVIPAIDNDAGSAAMVSAIRTMGQELDATVILANYALPQTAPHEYDMNYLLNEVTATSKWARNNGYQLCPILHQEVTGDYYYHLYYPVVDGGPYDGGIGDGATSYHEFIYNNITMQLNNHIRYLADASTNVFDGSLSGIASDCLNLTLFDLKSVSPALVDAGLQQNKISGDFYNYAQANDTVMSFPLFDTSAISTNDGLHFDRNGNTQMGQMLGRIWSRKYRDSDAKEFIPVSISIVDATTFDITYQVPCRIHGDCVDDPPISIDIVSMIARATQGAINSYGIHFWKNGILLTPGAISSAIPQTCTVPATDCAIRFTFASLPDFDSISFADTYGKVFGDPDYCFGPSCKYSGGSNIVSRVNSACFNGGIDGGSCIEQPGFNRFTVNPYDSGISPDSGFTATNVYYLNTPSLNYLSLAMTWTNTQWVQAGWFNFPPVGDKVTNPIGNYRGQLWNNSSQLDYHLTITSGRRSSGTFTVGNRYHYLAVYDSTGPTLDMYINGVLANGGILGGTITNTPNTQTGTYLPDPSFPSGTSVLDEQIYMPGKASITTQEIANILCATRHPTIDSSFNTYCIGATTDISYICGLATGTIWLGMEQNGNDRCGTLNATNSGTPVYTAY